MQDGGVLDRRVDHRGAVAVARAAQPEESPVHGLGAGADERDLRGSARQRLGDRLASVVEQQPRAGRLRVQASRIGPPGVERGEERLARRGVQGL